MERRIGAGTRIEATRRDQSVLGTTNEDSTEHRLSRGGPLSRSRSHEGGSGERSDRLLALDQLLEPLHAFREVNEIGRPRALRVAIAQRVVDVPVAPLGGLDGVLLDH